MLYGDDGFKLLAIRKIHDRSQVNAIFTVVGGHYPMHFEIFLCNDSLVTWYFHEEIAPAHSVCSHLESFPIGKLSVHSKGRSALSDCMSDTTCGWQRFSITFKLN